MEFEGEAFDVCENFESEFADELEAMEAVEAVEESAARRQDRGVSGSRRNLALTSPFQTSGGVSLSRKRPIDDESVLFPSDKRQKVWPREGSSHSPSSPPASPTRTPSRRGYFLKNNSSPGTLRRGNERCSPPSHYSPLSPLSPPHSPPTSQHTEHDRQSAVQHADHSLSTHTPSHSTTRTPHKTTPISTGTYRRTLDTSSLEQERNEERETERHSYARMTTHSGSYESVSLSVLAHTGENTSDPVFSEDSPVRKSQATSTNGGSRFKRLYALSRVPSGPHVTVTNGDGTRVYLRMKSSQQLSSKQKFSHSQLLSVPVADLRETAEEGRRAKLIRQADDLLLFLQESTEEADGSQTLLAGDGGLEQDTEESGHLLYVDKYSPHHYTELLSDDGINRTLLSWLRLWDEVVFGRPIPLKANAPNKVGGDKADKGPGGKFASRGNRFEKKFELQDPATFSGQEALDETRRPKIKLSLLCGAPGLGKTTLAHIIAAHAGYNVVEMNASDDRSPEVFRQRIEAATQMQAVLTVTTKPNCLIIDEIDGAPIAAINVLIEFVTKREKLSKKKSANNILSRPIICICNDQYAPSLRQLRQHSLLLHFPPITTSRLASRLYQVTKKEGLNSNMSTLIALCEKTSNDIRASLNTIQFLSRKGRDITLGLVQATSVGQKDSQRSLFSLWKYVFQLPTSKKHTLNQGPLKMGHSSLDNTSNLGTNATRLHNILLSASATGEYEKSANGLFENYLLVKLRDPNLEAVSVAQDWIIFHDHLQQHIAHMQDYQFMTYLPFLSVAFHFLFANSSKAQLKYPSTSYEVFLRTQSSRHLLSSILLQVNPQIRRTLNRILLVCEVLPFILEIIAPSFRPVSTQLYSGREKQQLVDLVGTMIAYTLTYRQERGMDGQYTYLLDPNIEDLCKFPGQPQRKQLSYSTKQLIAREVDMEKMRRAENILSTRNKDTRSEVRQSINSEPNDKADKPQKKFTPVIKDSKTPVDFFGRAITPSRAKGPRGRNSKYTTTHPLWFKFNEGYSNAVRRPIRIQSLL